MRRCIRWNDVLIPAALLGLTLAGAPAFAKAQETAAETLVPGRRAITFQPFAAGGGTTIGVWRVRDGASNLGLLLNASLSHNRQSVDGDDNDASSTSIRLGVGPEIRRYRSMTGRVVPFGFVGGRVRVDFDRSEFEPLEPVDAWSWGMEGRAGMGAEFFPVRNVGLDAQVGVVSGITYTPRSDPDRFTLGFNLGTFTASLGGAYYF